MARRGKLKVKKEFLPSDSWEHLKLKKKRLKASKNENYQKLQKQIKLLTANTEPSVNQSINVNMKSRPKHDTKNSNKRVREADRRRIRRLNSTICYLCRQNGHKISDCPTNSNHAQKNTTQCFICNSKSHNLSNCPRNKGKKGEITEYKFACCFVCKEQGHIANQCPKNPNGIYPRGGCCRTCGSKFHKQGECPSRDTVKQVSGESTHSDTRLNIMDTTSRDDDTQLNNEMVDNNHAKIKRKIVTFN